jgi:hypothetical protein
MAATIDLASIEFGELAGRQTAKVTFKCGMAGNTPPFVYDFEVEVAVWALKDANDVVKTAREQLHGLTLALAEEAAEPA